MEIIQQDYIWEEVLDTIPDKIIVCDSSFVSNGFDISYAGDLNNDGFSDFIIGDENASDQKWYATVYLGNQNLDSIKATSYKAMLIHYILINLFHQQAILITMGLMI